VAAVLPPLAGEVRVRPAGVTGPSAQSRAGVKGLLSSEVAALSGPGPLAPGRPDEPRLGARGGLSAAARGGAQCTRPPISGHALPVRRGRVLDSGRLGSGDSEAESPPRRQPSLRPAASEPRFRVKFKLRLTRSLMPVNRDALT
jgi:hypothetical protein